MDPSLIIGLASAIIPSLIGMGKDDGSEDERRKQMQEQRRQEQQRRLAATRQELMAKKPVDTGSMVNVGGGMPVRNEALSRLFQ